MVNNPYVSFATEDPYQQAAREAEQRAQLAELMKQQAFQPFEARPAPISRTEGIAKLLAAALAGMTERERRESAQKAREMDIEQATTELQRIAQPTDESVDIQELLGLPSADVERIKGVPGKFDITPTAPEFEISDTGEVSGFKPMELTTGETPDLGFQLPEMTPQQKRSAYIRMLGGGPVSQAFGQMGIEQTFKKPETAEFSPTVNYDAAGNAFVVNKAGEMQYLRGVTKPEDKPKIGVPGFDRFTAESLKKYEETGDENVLRDRPAPAKDERIVAVIGPDGKPRYVRESEALGMAPASSDRTENEERKMREEFQRRVKPFEDEMSQIGKVNDILNGAKETGGIVNAIQQDVLVTLLLKFIEPTSVVREGEFDRIVSRQGFVDQAKLFIKKLNTGEPLSQQAIQQIGEMANLFNQAANNKVRRIANQYKGLAERGNLNVENVILEPNYLTPLGGERTSTSVPRNPRRPRIPGSSTGTPPAVDVSSANDIVRGGR